VYLGTDEAYRKGREKVSRKITRRVVGFAAGTALVTAALIAVAAIAEDDHSFGIMRHPPID